jgi:methyl-accepting chemotaxis protein
MATGIEFGVFTVVPICVMGAVIVYSSLKAYEFNDKRPVLLVALLSLMLLHQLTEVAQFGSGTYYRTTSTTAETFESSANLLASVASYFVLQQISDLRTARNELEASNAALEERSSMVSVLNRILRHNVRNDINVIAGQAAYIRQNISDDRFEQELMTIEETAWGLVKISDRTQRIRQLSIEDPTNTTTFVLRDCLETLVERVEENVPDANITLDAGGDGETTIKGPSTLPTAVADVIEEIITSNSNSVNVDITVTQEGAQTGEGSDQVTIVIDDDGEGLPELDVQALENEEETPLKHAEGLSLWCLEWAVKRAGGNLDTDPDDATLRIRLPKSE